MDVLFERWLLETETLERISHHAKVTLSTTVRKFKSLWGISVPLLTYKGSGRVLIVDGIILERGVCILIAIDGDGAPITWMECIRENSASWIVLLTLVKNQGVPNPSIIVSDAQKGLLGGIKSVFPTIPHQRCMTHVVRLAQAWLTRNPKTVAGQELRAIINTLYGVTSKSEAMVFKQRFSIWLTTHHSFLKEKSTSSDTGRSWYTHRRLRGVRSLIVLAIGSGRPSAGWLAPLDGLRVGDDLRCRVPRAASGPTSADPGCRPSPARITWISQRGRPATQPSG